MLTLLASARAMPMMIAALLSHGVKEGDVGGMAKGYQNDIRAAMLRHAMAAPCPAPCSSQNERHE
jgi:hypothetical protein